MSYSLKHNDVGGSLTADYVMEINVFLAKHADMAHLDAAFNVLNGALQTLINDNKIQGYSLYAYETDHALDCNNKIESSISFLDANGFDSVGCNFWLTKCDLAVGFENAWRERTHAFLGTDRYSQEGLIKNMYIQEVFHSFINDDCEHVRDLLNVDKDQEHLLGKVYEDSSLNRASPMVSTYVGHTDYEARGDCKSSLDYAGVSNYSQTLTSCTKDAIYYSWQHEKYKPDPH